MKRNFLPLYVSIFLLLTRVANAKSNLEFVLALSGQNSNSQRADGETVVATPLGEPENISHIADQLAQSIIKSTSYISLQVIEVNVLDKPDQRLKLSQKALEFSQGQYSLKADFRQDMHIVFESNSILDSLPLPNIIQVFTESILTTFPYIDVIALRIRGSSEPVYYFPSLEKQRRVPQPKHKEVIEYWAEHAEFAIPRDIVIDGEGNRSLRKNGSIGRNLAVADASWTSGGLVQTAVGRVLFQMGSSNYICSGTTVKDTATDRSIILTAAHCVYDDAAKKFATKVLFIPNQDATTGTRTDFVCTNDPLGCWSASFGVVETKMASKQWPDNIPDDYGYFVVSNKGANSGSMAVPEALDQAVSPLPISFTTVAASQYAYSLGYPGNRDPDLRYCADEITIRTTNGYLLRGCDMRGGSSGGPWIYPMTIATGSGPIVSVNSYGFSNANPRSMGGPFLGVSAQCVFSKAQELSLTGTSTGGYIMDSSTACSTTPPPPPTCQILKTGCDNANVKCCSNETCQKFNKKDFRCVGLTGATCSSTSQCTSTNTCKNGVCLGLAGATCANDNQCSSNTCSGGKCLGLTGDKCSSASQCVSNNVCKKGLCLAVVGSTCSSNDQCSSNKCSGGLCLGEGGNTCLSDAQCSSSRCQNGSCLGLTGDTCSTNINCVGNKCKKNVCK